MALDLPAAKQRYLDFVASRKTLAISCIADDGSPFISYAPFVHADGKLYIYISQLAEHYQLIDRRHQANVMLLADESESSNLFGRERSRWLCAVRNLGNEGNEPVFSLFNARFGEKMLSLLRGLDFSLFELTPQPGRYVVGFGQAFDVSIDGTQFDHVVIDKKAA
ncbi:HugZ family protein [Jeongeupia naejangsanensis]|uniref:Pyridoxamine 5'-phosphate oxidase family protein n=1 Tax=Jeongeupia naejangsanensis TaxID=613195 RepID=A0ABS2BFF3_9NEIS|nr:pyridoxamine 5'-phosphate oxidase family protein [Jeongeupia naejangsanensis]MBM3114339.1 pyridoxamine 5'-phosphate oxidase family protein [Jeongeupia naejangsanensis]